MVSAPSDGHVGRRRAASLGYRDDYMIVPLGKQEGGVRHVLPRGQSRVTVRRRTRSTRAIDVTTGFSEARAAGHRGPLPNRAESSSARAEPAQNRFTRRRGDAEGTRSLMQRRRFPFFLRDSAAPRDTIPSRPCLENVSLHR